MLYMTSSNVVENFFHGVLEVDVHLAKGAKNTAKASKEPKRENKYIEKRSSHKIMLDLKDTEQRKRKTSNTTEVT